MCTYLIIGVSICLLIVYLCYDTMLLEQYEDTVDDIKKNISSGKTSMEDKTTTDLTDQDKFIKCPNMAGPNDLSDAYHQCCKRESNQAVCNHPVFKECKKQYLSTAKDKTFINYFGNKNTYNMAKTQFKKCVSSINDSFPLYKDQKYTASNPKINHQVTRLHSLKNKSNLKLLCKNMCNIHKGDCAGYMSDDNDCLLYKDAKPLINPLLLTKGEYIRGNKHFYIKA